MALATSELADLMSGALAEEIASAASEGMRVFAVTSPATVVAALAARELGATELALAGGFTALDASPSATVTLGEAGFFTEGAVQRDWATDVFALLSRGRVGVAVSPAQLDAEGRTNLSAVGSQQRPKVALPGARGLPDNNASPARVWYFLPAHSPRVLVERVDVICGPKPSADATRRLLSPAGLFELAESNWNALWLTPDGAELVARTPAFPIETEASVEIRDTPLPASLEALERVDPHRIRALDFAARDEAAEIWTAAIRRERAGPLNS